MISKYTRIALGVALVALVFASAEQVEAGKRFQFRPYRGPVRLVPKPVLVNALGPDLKITKVVHDAKRTDRAWITVKNLGNVSAYGSYLKIIVYNPYNGALMGTKTVTVRSLTPGKSTTFIVYGPKPFYGTCFRFIIDATNAVKETNEKNNVWYNCRGVVR